MPQPLLYQQHDIILYRDGIAQSTQALIVVERPLKIYLDRTEITTVICSPGNWTELGIGFLFNRGLIQNLAQIKSIKCDEENNLLWVETYTHSAHQEEVVPGVRDNSIRHIEDRFRVSDLLEWIATLDRQSASFKLTGGVHSAALAGEGNGLLVRFEDIGRHNAVDRVLGYMFLNGVTPDNKCLVLSGRIASEIFLKAAQVGLPLILSRSAPTMHTVQLAEQLGITVVGFARGSQLSVYSHGERILF